MEESKTPDDLKITDSGQGQKLSDTTKTAVLNVLYNNLQKTIIDCVAKRKSLLLSVSDETPKLQSLSGRAMVSIPGDIQVVSLSKDVQNILMNEEVYLSPTSDQPVEDGEEGVEFRKEIVLETPRELPDDGVWNCLCLHCKTSFSRKCPVFKNNIPTVKKVGKRRKKNVNAFNPRRLRVTCEYCGKTVTNQSLKFHMEAHQGKRYPCHYCTKTFKTPFSRNRHEKVHFQGHHKTICCTHCPKSFYTQAAFNVHLNTKHKNVERHFCSICDKGFYFANQLELHMKSHAGGNPFVCKTCSDSFPSRYKLSTHMKKHSQVQEVTERIEGTLKAGVAGLS